MNLKKMALGISSIALASTISIATPADEYSPIYIQDLYTESSYTMNIQPTATQNTVKKETNLEQSLYQGEKKEVVVQPAKYVQASESAEVPKQDVRINASKTETEPKSETKTVVESQQNNNDTTEIKTAETSQSIDNKQLQTETDTTVKTEEKDTVISKKAPYYNNWSLEEAQEKVSAVGDKLIEINGFTDMGVKFHVSDEPTVNAYADGNRNVVIFTGLLELCESEDELAFIMSHEIAHITGYHIAKRKIAYKAAGAGSKAAKKQLGGFKNKVAQMAKEYGVEKYGVKPELVDNAVDTAAVAGVTYYDRRHEIDADTQGMDIMQKAGYNPLAGIAIMYRIGDNYNDIFTDHPSTDKRVVKMYNHAAENSPEELKKGYDSIYYNEAISIMKSKD